jgi:hypothetical protein
MHVAASSEWTMVALSAIIARCLHAAHSPRQEEESMDRDAVIAHLRAWADGVDPATGAVLPSDHPGQQPGTLRVIFAALGLLVAEQSFAPSRANDARPAFGARNAGRPWSAIDDVALATAFDSGTTIGALAVQMQRTRGAITARLVKLGKIEAPPGLRLRGEASLSQESRMPD